MVEFSKSTRANYMYSSIMIVEMGKNTVKDENTSNSRVKLSDSHVNESLWIR